jgi:hypothetical protein
MPTRAVVVAAAADVLLSLVIVTGALRSEIQVRSKRKRQLEPEREPEQGEGEGEVKERVLG